MADLNKDLEKIIKEGYLEKESRFFKSWRKYVYSYSGDGLSLQLILFILSRRRMCIILQPRCFL